MPREVVREPFWHFLDPTSDSLPLTSSAIYTLLGPQVAEPLAEGLHRLVREFSHVSFENAVLYAPTLEGVGYYPQLDEELRMRPHPLWVAGDATGVFRGLTAALVSGYFVGLRAA